MKLKGLSKIAIAGAALAATAATLGTSTYAWYVSNQEATATGVVAQMQDSTGGSIYISKDGDKFFSTVAFTSADFQENNEPGNIQDELFPITTQDGKAFTDDGDADHPTGNAVTGKRLVLHIWLKSDNDVTIQPRLGVTNLSTADDVEQTLYADINQTYSSGDTLAVDAVEALRMGVAVGTADPSIYDVKGIAKNPSALNTAYSTPTGFASATQVTPATRQDNLGAAHGYYKDVTGAAPRHTTPANASSSWGTFDLEKNVAVALTFTFWLEGADTECFDSCAGQEIQFLFDFILS